MDVVVNGSLWDPAKVPGYLETVQALIDTWEPGLLTLRFDGDATLKGAAAIALHNNRDKPFPAEADQAMNGGIDLNADAMQWNLRKEGLGVRMDIDPAMVERIKAIGIESLTPVIYNIRPMASIRPLLGLNP